MPALFISKGASMSIEVVGAYPGRIRATGTGVRFAAGRESPRSFPLSSYTRRYRVR
jgi:hypothetical protein